MARNGPELSHAETALGLWLRHEHAQAVNAMLFLGKVLSDPPDIEDTIPCAQCTHPKAHHTMDVRHGYEPAF